MFQTCSVCCEDLVGFTFQDVCANCDLLVCDDCFSEWTKRHLETQLREGMLEWKCPSEQCPAIPLDTFISRVALAPTSEDQGSSEKKQALLNLAAELSFTHFARNTQDLRRCPTADCQYWGFMPVPELSKCQRALVCPTCEHSWFEQCQKRGSELPYNGLASNLRQLLISSPCPNCGLKIQKDYGCQHMSCAKCQFEFCWFCLTQYTSY